MGLADPGTSRDARIALLDARLRSQLGFPEASRSLDGELDSVGQFLSRQVPSGGNDSTRRAVIARWLDSPAGIAPVLAPDDTDLVPSLAWERHRGGCTSLAFVWQRLAARLGMRLSPVFLPGHVILERPDGKLLESLRGGMERSRAFYDSAFVLARRPAYRNCATDPDALVAALAIQCGLLDWKAGDLDAAREVLEFAVGLAPGLPEAEGNLGLVQEAMGDRVQAMRHLGRAVAGDSLNLRARAWWLALAKDSTTFKK